MMEYRQAVDYIEEIPKNEAGKKLYSMLSVER